ncbi:neuraminidase/exo-alpha-sialidase nanH [Canicola haemoglobinophilus]|uniref:exo-alpha-sialidase n=1 Tax=Canicola haemoglobinophilus TaxID=733 RepID=A0AB38H7T8_9PAST|nr:exo-alpha-sialidase [Canicola haemoglobinophilus]STO53673.1 neuraminidase/exo-alpha-sialidase nanH [Canicola haemoglobinophilus]STO68206.1 neuraminidase/exo-alpha-sialidase nanH [Canicola haemoglobinophilus]
MKKFRLKNAFIPSLIFLALSSTLHANSFWKADLNENLTNITKRKGIDNFTVNVPSKPWEGVGPNGEAPGTVNLHYSRIPAMTITEDNKLVVMFDLRWNGANDQNRIDPGIAISEDGGHTWTRKTAWTFDVGKNPRRRAMDPTILHNPIDGSLYVMHGTWASGTTNWNGARINYFNNNVWATTIYKSTDDGHTWGKNAEFSKQSNPEVFSKVQKGNGNPVIGFLGGVGSGIVMRDGTLVFPIQTTHQNSNTAGSPNRTNTFIATTLMYSTDNGKTWDMKATKTPLSMNGQSLENMVFEVEPGKLVVTGRGNNRWAYYTTDLGETWHEFTPVNGFSGTTSQTTQGSSLYVTLPNGRKVLLVSKPNGNNDNWSRGNLALWMLDAKDPNHKYQVEIIRPGSGNAAGAGYSSLAYKDGNLFIAYEDDGDITVKNLTNLMEKIEAKALEWNLPDVMAEEIEKINAMDNLNKAQKDELIAKMRKANDYAIPLSVAIDGAMEDLKEKTNDLKEKAKAVANALPSSSRFFSAGLADVNRITSPDDTTYLDYLGINSLYDDLHSRFLALTNTKLDFDKYAKSAQALNEYNHDILYRSFDNVFAHYDVGSKYNRLSLGANAALSDNFKVGLFFEHRHKDLDSYETGIRAQYQKDAHQVSGFVRYRGVKHQNMLERNNNIDAYVNYAYQLKLNEQLSISPSLGAYVSRSSRTLIDEDVAVNKRTLYAGDVGFNVEYKFNDVSVNIRPNVALINDDMTLSQSNYSANNHKVGSSNVIYGLSTGLEKRFNNGLTVGSNLKLQKYGSQHSETNFGVNVSYRW